MHYRMPTFRLHQSARITWIAMANEMTSYERARWSSTTFKWREKTAYRPKLKPASRGHAGKCQRRTRTGSHVVPHHCGLASCGNGCGTCRSRQRNRSVFASSQASGIVFRALSDHLHPTKKSSDSSAASSWPKSRRSTWSISTTSASKDNTITAEDEVDLPRLRAKGQPARRRVLAACLWAVVQAAAGQWMNSG